MGWDVQWISEPAMGAAIGRILLISLDEAWAQALSCHLRTEGFAVGVAASPAGLRARLAEFPAEVVVADAGAHGSAAVLSASVRAATDALLLVTGGSESDVVAATMAGADGYSPRSASARVLTARTRVLLRRFRDPAAGTLIRPEVLAIGLLNITTAGTEPVADGSTLVLDDVSYAVLSALLRQPGTVVTRADLLREIGQPLGHSSSLDLAVRRLREHLERRMAGRRIVAVRGVGYRYESDGGEAEIGSPASDHLQQDGLVSFAAGGIG